MTSSPGAVPLDAAPPRTLSASLSGFLSAWRDRLVSRPAFRDWAARFPLTRPIARRRARALFDLVAGFAYSQTLAACVQLELFARLAPGPATALALAPGLGLTPEATDRLCAAATALGLLERRGPAYGLGPLGAAMVDNPAVSAMVRHHATLYADLADPVALFRQGRGRLADFWGYAGTPHPATLPGTEIAAYSDLMAASQPLVAAEILAAYDIRPHRKLLDIGGGDGAFLRAAHQKAPALQLALFDLPEVAARARATFARTRIDADTAGGDMMHDPLPTGADLLTLVRVVHDHDDDRAMCLLRNVRAAMDPGSTLLLAEPMAGLPGAERVGDAYFGLYLLAMGSGRARSPARLCAMLREAGFAHAKPRRTATPIQTGLIVARA